MRSTTALQFAEFGVQLSGKPTPQEDTVNQVFPGEDWEVRSPDEFGFFGEKLAGVESWLRASNPDT